MYETMTRATLPRLSRQAVSFDETEFLLDETDAGYGGFAPTQLFAGDFQDKSEPADESWMPASWVTSRWVEAQEAKAVDDARRIQAANAARRRADDAESTAPPAALGLRRQLQTRLDRLLPPDSRGVLALFICVALSVGLICSVLPLIDKL